MRRLPEHDRPDCGWKTADFGNISHGIESCAWAYALTMLHLICANCQPRAALAVPLPSHPSATPVLPRCISGRHAQPLNWPPPAAKVAPFLTGERHGVSSGRLFARSISSAKIRSELAATRLPRTHCARLTRLAVFRGDGVHKSTNSNGLRELGNLCFP